MRSHRLAERLDRSFRQPVIPLEEKQPVTLGSEGPLIHPVINPLIRLGYHRNIWKSRSHSESAVLGDRVDDQMLHLPLPLSADALKRLAESGLGIQSRGDDRKKHSVMQSLRQSRIDIHPALPDLEGAEITTLAKR